MLKGIDPLLDADILHALRSMGHGDVLIVADANFPAATIARETVLGRVLRMDVSTPRAVKAVLSVLPLDTFDDDPVRAMQVVGAPEEVPEVRAEVAELLDGHGGLGLPIGLVERRAFYELAKASFAVIQTVERRFYGCIALTKGVVEPDA